MAASDPNVFVDANVLMELFFRRQKYNVAVDTIAALSSQVIATSVLALSILMYYVESKGFDKATAHKFLLGYQILDMNSLDYTWAQDNDQGDFEDALQIACARRHGCGMVITLDQGMERMYGKHITVNTIR